MRASADHLGEQDRFRRAGHNGDDRRIRDRFGNQTSITTGQYLVDPHASAYDPAKAARALPATTRIAYDAMDRKVL